MILCAFAVGVGTLTTRRIRSDFYHQIAAAADDLRDRVDLSVENGKVVGMGPNLDLYAAPGHATIRVLALDGTVVGQTRSAPNLGTPFLGRTAELNGYRVETREIPLRVGGEVFVQYARRVSDLEVTIDRVRLFLFVGVLAGTGLALLAGLMLARRAMSPIAELTEAASEIERTRDPAREVPTGEADDEVAELARTLNGMLASLAASRAETEAMLERQRQFVADASHELRTPLTSVLANLELLAESLAGDSGEVARSALRSSRRMRRLVGDLLLLARADVGRGGEREPTDLREIVIEAAAELGPVAEAHDLSLEVSPAPVHGSRDELHRMAINLMENALRHTPPGTRVRVLTGVDGDGCAWLEVCDDGPGVPAELRGRLFERFSRGAGDRGGSFGIGLAIVRAVAEAHSGSVSLQTPPGGRGALFTVRLQALEPAHGEGAQLSVPVAAGGGRGGPAGAGSAGRA